MLSGRLIRRSVALVLSVPLLIAGSAQAAIGGSVSCQPSAVSEPFAGLGDPTTYELVPGGDFQGTLGGWSVQGSATVTDSGLSLDAGSVATSPQACVNVVHPSVRFYARSATRGATIQVAAVVDNPAGTVATPIGTVTPTAELSPSEQLIVRVPLLRATASGVLVGLRFEARGGSSQIDDVYIDPWRSG